MAYVNGISGSKTWTLGGYFKVKLSWTDAYDVALNKSIVSVRMYLYSDTYGGTWFPNGTITIDDDQIVEMNYYGTATHMSGGYTIYQTEQEVINQPGSTGVAPPWKSSAIGHNSDGSKKVTIKINSLELYNLDIGSIYLGNVSVDINLTTIPRSSSLSLSDSSVDIEQSITANITRASTSFTHDVEFYINNTYYQKYTGITTSKQFTIPKSWYNAMPSATSCTAYCRITTYNGSTQVGDKVRKSFTVTVPSDIIPTVGTITLNPTDINGHNILVKGKNKLNISVSGSAAGTGSSIKSYTFSGPSLTKTTTTNTSVAVSSVSATGELTYTVKVTDNRGRTASNTAKINCYNYFAPTFKTFNAYRANADGTANVNGTYLKCTYTTNYASVNSTNSVTVTMYYNNTSTAVSGGSVLINLNGDTNTTYQVHLEITDTYGGSATSATLSVFGEMRIINITQDGTGVAIGKMAGENNMFDCRWPMKANGFAIPEIQKGRVSITPSAANTPTSKIVTFNQAFSGTPVVVATPYTSVPGTSMLGVGVQTITTSSATIYLTRTDTTTMNIGWIAMY